MRSLSSLSRVSGPSWVGYRGPAAPVAPMQRSYASLISWLLNLRKTKTAETTSATLAPATPESAPVSTPESAPESTRFLKRASGSTPDSAALKSVAQVPRISRRAAARAARAAACETIQAAVATSLVRPTAAPASASDAAPASAPDSVPPMSCGSKRAAARAARAAARKAAQAVAAASSAPASDLPSTSSVSDLASRSVSDGVSAPASAPAPVPAVARVSRRAAARAARIAAREAIQAAAALSASSTASASGPNPAFGPTFAPEVAAASAPEVASAAVSPAPAPAAASTPRSADSLLSDGAPAPNGFSKLYQQTLGDLPTDLDEEAKVASDVVRETITRERTQMAVGWYRKVAAAFTTEPAAAPWSVDEARGPVAPSPSASPSVFVDGRARVNDAYEPSRKLVSEDSAAAQSSTVTARADSSKAGLGFSSATIQGQATASEEDSQRFSPSKFLGMSVVFLGTSSGSPTRSRNTQSIALKLHGGTFLFDAGEGAQHRILGSPFLHPGSLDHIFITHLHGDHILGLPGVIHCVCCNMTPGMPPLHVYGPPGLRRMLRVVFDTTESRLSRQVLVHELGFPPLSTLDPQLAAELFPNWTPSREKRYAEIQQFVQRRNAEKAIYPDVQGVWHIYEDEKVTVKAVNLHHTVPCWGYVVTEKDSPGRVVQSKLQQAGLEPGPLYSVLKMGIPVTTPSGRVLNPVDFVGPKTCGRKVVILGDTCNSDNILRIGSDADLLVHECTLDEALFPEAVKRGHSTPSMVGSFAKRLRAYNLVTTHYSAKYDVGKLTAPSQNLFFPPVLANTHPLAIMAKQVEDHYGRPVISALDYMMVSLMRRHGSAPAKAHVAMT